MFRSLPIVHVAIFVTFFASGLAVNAVQVALFVLLVFALKDRKTFRRINYYLVYVIYGQILFLADWWSSSEIRLHVESDETDVNAIGASHAIIVMNHHYEVDWLFGWMVADRFNVLGNARVYLKKSLRFVPVMGWCWAVSDVVFLDRDWNRDKDAIAYGIGALADFPDPMFSLIFAEGTRMSPKKLEASLEFAAKNGLPALKHHLVPRTKGFAHTMKHLDSRKIPALYDVTLAVNEEDGAPPTLNSVFKGKKIVGDMYIRRFETKDLPLKDEQKMTEFLHNLYKEKDDLKDNYLKTGTFTPTAVKHVIPPRKYSALLTLTLNALISVPLAYQVFAMFFFSGSLTQMTISASIVLLLGAGLSKMIGLTEISKATNYGLKKND